VGHEQIGSFFQRIVELSGGIFGIEVHKVLADDDTVVVLATVKAQRNGFRRRFPKCTFGECGTEKPLSFGNIKATNSVRIVSGRIDSSQSR